MNAVHGSDSSNSAARYVLIKVFSMNMWLCIIL